MTAITSVALSDLRIDEKANTRTVNRGTDQVLVASIKAIGLRMPLTVRPNGKGYVVIDGGQRLEALRAIQKEGMLPKDYAVPVVIGAEAENAAREVSLHLNVARLAMHPVDEYRSFAKLADDKASPMTTAQIAERFGVEEKVVHQRLALGALDESILNAWTAGEIGSKIAQLFTLQPNKKAQKAALEKARTGGGMNDYMVRSALGLDENRSARYLALVGDEAYIARGGKITRDLFGENHQISDVALLKVMVDEVLDNKVKELLADGWSWATKDLPDDQWRYSRLRVEGKPTKDEAAKLKALEKLIEETSESDAEDAFEQNERASEEFDALQDAINLRAITKEIKATAGCFVQLSSDGRAVLIDFRTKPVAEKAQAPVKDEQKKAEKKKAPEDAISQALLQRQAEQLTAAASAAVLKQPHVAVAILIAGITSNDEAVTIHQKAYDAKRVKFETALASALKLTPAKQMEVLTQLLHQNINLVVRNSDQPVQARPAHKALIDAINGKALTAAIRENWDATDYFNSVSRATIVEAVREAMGDDHAANVAKMNKEGAVNFAYGNLPRLKWLPKQLRVAGYDGPKAKAAKATAKKAKH